jgi:organic radical activating enzyme
MSGNKPNSSTFLKKLLLGKSETFCINPWIHLHTTPTGVAAPCCIAESCATVEGVGNSREQNLMQLVNSDKMKQLRLNMLTGVKSEECKKCYQHEAQDVRSFRQMANEQYKHAFDDVVENTNLVDGSLSKFKMRYFDVRFSNICNFKCRTCGSAFSTQWEQEDLKNNVWYAKVHPKNDNKEFLNDVIEQIDNMEIAYFAGGEPLITEEHYILLEEMIRRNRDDIILRYNTNFSNLKFKNKDILGLWKHFKNRVEIYASIDHYGARAEYIRHGTEWDVIEENFLKAKKTPFINIQINTVLSVFNLLTFYDFYKYLIDKGMYSPSDSTYTVYNMSTPEHLTCHILPEEYKLQGIDSINRTIALMKEKGFSKDQISQLEVCPQWILSQNTWEDHKQQFREEVKRLDAIRGEAFMKTFPEIAEIYKVNQRKMWPV